MPFWGAISLEIINNRHGIGLAAIVKRTHRLETGGNALSQFHNLYRGNRIRGAGYIGSWLLPGWPPDQSPLDRYRLKILSEYP